MTQHEDWLNLTTEEVIDPDLPICDPHFHLRKNKDFLYSGEDFKQDISGGHRIQALVAVQSFVNLVEGPDAGMLAEEETDYLYQELETLTRGSEINFGIVGSADFTLGGAIEQQLNNHIAAGKGKFRGVRGGPMLPPSGKEAPSNQFVDWFLENKVIDGFTTFSKFNLTYEVMVFPFQYEALLGLAGRFSDITIIINHLGCPIIRDLHEDKKKETVAAWRKSIINIAEHQNIYMKLGGMAMPVFGFNWRKLSKPPSSSDIANTVSPYFETCIEQFGADRCMLESNFPVDKEGCSYTVLWNAFKKVCSGYSKDEQGALFYNTAKDVYRLGV